MPRSVVIDKHPKEDFIYQTEMHGQNQAPGRRMSDRPRGALPRRTRRKATAAASPGRAYHAPALEKGLDILEYLATGSVPVSQADLARALGRTASEIFRMLVLLERRGYVCKDTASGRYSLSLRLYAMAHAHNPFEHLLRAARLPMQLLAERANESCHLGVVRGGRLLIAARAEAPTPIRLSIETGAQFEVNSTSSGRLIAALLDEERLAWARLERPSDADRIRARGWLVEPSHVHEGVENISVPIHVGGEVAALTIAWIRGRGGSDRTEQLLAAGRDCAAAISRGLGLAGMDAMEGRP
jgi:DNA-binding IclR family transcriptional regulator